MSGSNVYGIETLVGNWPEDRYDPKHQQPRMIKEVFQLPTKTAKNWGKTSDAYGSTMAEEMNVKLNSTRIENVLKYADLDPSTQYSTTSRRMYSDPATKEIPCEKQKHSQEWLKEYRKEWTNGEPHQFQRKEF